MYSENRINDSIRFLKAFVTNQKAFVLNQIVRFAPHTYFRLFHRTGRGDAPESIQEIADYFQKCMEEYFEQLGVTSIKDYLKGKYVLEYGPGDIPGVALLMYAYGADQVTCIDRFPLVSLSKKNIEVLTFLLSSLPDRERKRAELAFNIKGEPGSGFNPQYINYLVKPSGLSGATNKFDLIISRAVLEHVNRLDDTFSDIKQALKPEGVSIHQVDLRSHELHRYTPLDFLTWPPLLWSLMYNHKGYPNRWRIDKYRELIHKKGFKIIKMNPTILADQKDIDAVRPYLARPFRNISNEDLSWMVFWVVLRKESSL